MNDRDAGDEAVRHAAAHEPVRSTSVPYLVFGLLACAAVFSAAVVNGVIHDQERRLLDQRAQAAGALVSTSFSGFTSTMPLLGALAQPGLGGPDLFEAVATPFVANGGNVGTATRTDDGFAVQASVGDGPGADAPPHRSARRARGAGRDRRRPRLGRAATERQAPADVRGGVADEPRRRRLRRVRVRAVGVDRVHAGRPVQRARRRRVRRREGGPGRSPPLDRSAPALGGTDRDRVGGGGYRPLAGRRDPQGATGGRVRQPPALDGPRPRAAGRGAGGPAGRQHQPAPGLRARAWSRNAPPSSGGRSRSRSASRRASASPARPRRRPTGPRASSCRA